MGKYLVVYFDSKKKCKQIIRPTREFDGNWTALAYQISGSDDHKRKFHSYEVV